MSKPCTSCPYRKDAPIGLWDPVEFQNLLRQDADEMGGAVFQCHGEIKKESKDRKLCVGWLLDQRERGVPSIQLRIRLMTSSTALAEFEGASGEGIEIYPSIRAMCLVNGVGKDGRIVRRLPAPRRKEKRTNGR